MSLEGKYEFSTFEFEMKNNILLRRRCRHFSMSHFTHFQNNRYTRQFNTPEFQARRRQICPAGDIHSGEYSYSIHSFPPSCVYVCKKQQF
jgi:hypothetical protein